MSNIRKPVTVGYAAAIGLLVSLSAASDAYATDLTFSSDCRTYSPISVAGSHTGIAFTRFPNNSSTRGYNAGIFNINTNDTIALNAGTASCFYKVKGNDSYCFISRGNKTIVRISGIAGKNLDKLPACQ